MPVFSLLFQAVMGNAVALLVAIRSAENAVRLTAIAVLSAAYVACVVFYTTVIDPLIGLLFSTAYGQLLGLVFPPLAGSVLASFVALWGCIVAKRYTEKFVMMAVGK